MSSFSGFLTVNQDGNDESNASSEDEENCGIMMMGSTPQEEKEAKRIR